MGKIFGVRVKASATSVITKKDVSDYISGKSGLSAGLITLHTNNNIPTGWLLCDGAEHSCTEYQSLYNIIGSIYNEHPTLGSATQGKFRVPDFRDVFPVCASGSPSIGQYNTSGWNHTHTLPEHTHTLNSHTHQFSSHSHSVPSHSHSYSHTHTVSDHYHIITEHSHSFPWHAHSHNLTAYVTHYHKIYSDNNSNNGVADSASFPRSGDSSGTANTVNTSYEVASVSAVNMTIGVGSGPSSINAHPAFNSGSSAASLGTHIAQPSGLGVETSNGNSENSSVAISDRGLSSASNTAYSAGSNTINTNLSGASITGTANPPYFGIHFIIKT